MQAYLHSLQNKETGEHFLGEVEDIRRVDGDNCFIATLPDGREATAIYNPFVGAHFVDDVYGIVKKK